MEQSKGNTDDEIPKKVMEQSKGDAQIPFMGNEQSIAVQTALKNGFTEDQGIEAESLLVC